MGGGGPFVDAEDAGLCGRFTVFLRLATEELKLGALSLFGAPGRGGAAAGGLGADDVGGLGAEELLDDSGSDVEDDSRFAPVSTPPPRFFNFGMPPANMPASCGGCSIPETPVSLPLWSLLLRALFPPFGTGGASPPDGFDIPGIGGAPPNGADPDPPETFPTIGADRSFVTAFLRALPF